MGQYFQIHNLSKKQYFNANVFNENIKQSGILRGIHGFALGRLLTAGLSESNLLWRPGNEAGVYAGAWAGDRIAITGDYGQTDFFGVEPSQQENKPANLWDLAYFEFKNIGGKLLLWLAGEDTFREWLEKQLQQDSSYLATLGFIAYKYPRFNGELVAVLENVFGRQWEKRYRELWDKSGAVIIPDMDTL